MLLENKQLIGYYVADSGQSEVDKIKHRLSQPGLRHFDATSTSVQLPRAELTENYYTQRSSHRNYSTDVVPLVSFRSMLACIDQQIVQGRLKYKYGSAGSLYPVQC
jgi:epothilone synthetase B